MGGAEIFKRYKVGASFANVGIIAVEDGDTVTGGPVPCSTTVAQDSIGLAMDVATYDATPTLGDTNNIGVVTVSVRPDIVISAAMSGGATESTALTIMTNTAADLTNPDTVTSGDVEGNDMVSGTGWRLQSEGDEAGIFDQGMIITHTGSTSFVMIPDFVTPFTTTDRFLMCPWNAGPLDGTATTDGGTNVQTTTLFTQADQTIQSDLGLVVKVYQLRLRSATDSEVEFVQVEHVYLAIN